MFFLYPAVSLAVSDGVEEKQLPGCISDHTALRDVIVRGGSHLKFIGLRIVWLDYTVDIKRTVIMVD